MPDINTFYFVVARHSGKALDVTDKSKDNGAPIQQWSWSSRDRNKQFLFLPVDDGCHYIVARHSAKGLDVTDQSTADGAKIQQWDSTSGKPNKQFRLLPAGGGYYYIVAKHSGKALDVENRSTDEGARIQQWTYQSGRTNKHFRLEAAATITIPKISGTHAPAHEIGDVERLTGFHPPAETTTPVLIGEMLIPFLMVKDGAREEQVERNPYYKLSRYGYWKRVFYYEHDGSTQYEHQVTTTSGLTTTTAETIQSTTTMTVGADAGFKFSAVSLGVKANVNRALQVTESTSQTLMQQIQKVVKRTYPAGVRLAQSVWFRADKYVLTRADNSVVLRWEIVRDDEFVSDVYPEMPLSISDARSVESSVSV